METKQGQFYSGTSGMVLPVANKQAFPVEFQDRSRLCYYASLFNSLEVNSSFYKVPMAATVKKWVGDTPEGFRFTFKLWRDITHNKGLVFDPDAVTRFMQVISQAADKKASLLVQFPPSTKIDSLPQMTRLLEQIRQADPNAEWDLAVEFRHNSWYRDDTYRSLDRYQAALVLQDLPASATPMIETDANFVYIRFHGPDGGYRGSYTDAHLAEYAQYIRDWQAGGKTVYAYFNNTIGAAVHNLATLNGFVNVPY